MMVVIDKRLRDWTPPRYPKMGQFLETKEVLTNAPITVVRYKRRKKRKPFRLKAARAVRLV